MWQERRWGWFLKKVNYSRRIDVQFPDIIVLSLYGPLNCVGAFHFCDQIPELLRDWHEVLFLD